VNESIRTYDTDYLGHPHLIATGVIETDAGLLVVDPGPTTSLDTLTDKLAADGNGWADVTAVLLTHIHLDHAGATGTIVRQAPDVHVYVHERGAPHMANPERLLASARRIYGDDMDRLWGAFEAVPEANLTAVAGGESLTIGGRDLDVAYTPGHAQHHVSYRDVATGTAFIGDVGGMRVTGSDTILPVMPPPDVDLAAWHESIDTIRSWSPEAVFVTHFGLHTDVDRHLDVIDERIDDFAESVRTTLPRLEEADRETVATSFADEVLSAMREETDEAYWSAYERFGQPRDTWYGLARYWQKRLETSTPAS
jgi:glyoxylase-like metal-dependent hydrolase (beta-lactamase superfamily II)